MKQLLFILLVSSTFIGVAQTSNKKKVLVIPYSRFEFVSEFDMLEIAEKNEVTEANVFLTYQKALLNSFEQFKNENFEFVAPNQELFQPYAKFVTYKYDKYKGKQYNAIDIKSFPVAEFTKLLELHETDFVIFITWYDIQKEAFTRKGKHEKRASYAAHYIDYDVYNLFQQRVIGEAKVKAEAGVPNDLEVSFKLLRTKELASAYDNFISHIIEQLNKPIE